MAGVKNIPARVIDPKNITGNVEEGWKSKAAGAAMVGLSALGAAGHAKADNQDAKASTHISQDLPGKIAGSSYPTRAPVGTLYGSFIDKDGRKINKYVDSELTTKFKPDDEGPWDPQKYPTRAPVGTKYGSFVDKDGKKWDKYVGPELTAIFKPAKDEVGEAVTTNRKAIEIKNFMPEPGSILKITGHLLDRIVERTLDKDKISQLFGMAVKKQYRKEFLDAKEGDKLLIKTKSGFGIPIVKIQRPEGIYVYTAKTCHETIYPHPEDKILIVNAPDPSILESTLIGSLPSKKERWVPQVRGEKSAGDVAKKSQKPGVLNQKHPFNGRLVGGS
jgi:hypothetical protein